MRSEEFLNNHQKDRIDRIKDFIRWAIDVLELQKPYPKITLSNRTGAAREGHHTGVNTPHENHIWVYVGNRNLIDIFRTIFHELTHAKQHQIGLIQPGDSYPGSPIEMEADAMAGKYIKIYVRDHPDIIE